MLGQVENLFSQILIAISMYYIVPVDKSNSDKKVILSLFSLPIYHIYNTL